MELSSNFKQLIRVALALLAGIGFSFTWYCLPCLALLVFFPACWLIWPNRLLAALFVFGYYTSVNHEEVAAILQYFQGQYGIGIAVFLWLAHSALMSLPWVIFYTQPSKPLLNQLIRTLLLTLLLALPPLGYFIWGQPITAAGTLFPGLGWWGFILTLALMLLGVTLLKVRNYKLYFCIIVLLIISGISNFKYRPINPPHSWQAIDTHLGMESHNPIRSVKLQNHLISLSRKLLEQGHRLLVFPEYTIGAWSPETEALWKPVAKLAAEQHANIVLGTEWDETKDAKSIGIVILGADGPQFIAQRQPIPLGVWNPFSKPTYEANWTNPAKVSLGGETVALSICYENSLSWPVLQAFLSTPQPAAIVGIANQWWNIPRAYNKQLNTLKSWAQLFGVPLVQATNT